MHETTGARDAMREDLEGDRQQYERPSIVWCTAGWPGDANVVDLGASSNEGRTIVKATLYDGKVVGIAPQAGLAQGHRVLVQVGGPLFAVPPAGTQLCVAFPNNDIETPGNGIILQWAQSSPTQQFAAGTMVLQIAGSSLVLGFAGGEQVTIQPASVQIGAQSPGNHVALAETVDSNFSAIANFLNTIFTGGSATSLTASTYPVVAASPAIVPSPTATGSSTVTVTP